ncbi:Undecaprenyl-diphosphatase [Clostridium acidisoli DSM 12555]|uniref:Undecaprenyl-diphosphatase n=1 Tax=Clostridium acidisoli DSM 12555 TaxID=1121291 RepID=A0A1W1XPS4_9CLOT|nr:undecaprenyl-diphosphate phosphatase [Clostridium acidisoli]SMC25874.1 Undecaprenyl-diphosphatase [Clostridium acidisoli DSM 12555]
MSANFLIIIKVIILGIVEGVTEFLPVSSTGHLIMFNDFLNFNGKFSDLFDIVIQLGAILAVVVLFWDKLLESLKTVVDPTFKSFGSKLWRNLIIAFIPSGLIGVLTHKFVNAHLMKVLPVSLALLVGGIFMILAENKFRKNSRTKDIADVTVKQAFVIGCFQCLSVIWPGFSRSASTIIGGWIVGLSTVAAAEFSFFLAIPTMIIATGYELISNMSSITGAQFLQIAIGFIVSFIVALLVVEKFMNFLKKRPMRVFAIYRIIFSVIFLILAVTKIINVA